MAQNLSGILVRQQLQATIASTRPDALTNPKVGASFQPSIRGGLNEPGADVLYTFTAVCNGSAGADVDGVVTLNFSTAAITLSNATATNRSSSSTKAQDAEGNDATGLNATTGRIVAVMCYTNPSKHTSNIMIEEGATTDVTVVPKFEFSTGGSDVKSIMWVPHIAPGSSTLKITFGVNPTSAGGADELNVVVLGRSS
jgi:hypothetical protein